MRFFFIGDENVLKLVYVYVYFSVVCRYGLEVMSVFSFQIEIF